MHSESEHPSDRSVRRRWSDSYWFATLQAVEPHPTLTRTRAADVVVVGGGFTGLAAAYYLKKTNPNLEVVLLEGAILGAGASSRNSGAVSPRFRGHDPNAATQRGYQFLKQFVASENVDCDLAEGVPAIYLAPSERGLDGEADFVGEALAVGIGSAFYGAARATTTNALHPGKLVRGLAGANVRVGVEIHERSPVVDLRRSDGHWIVSTPSGAVRAPQVILATNVYTPQLGFAGSRIAVLHHRVIVTRPLTDEEWRISGLERWPLRFETGNYYTHTVRSTPDRRFFYRHVLGHRRDERVTWKIDAADRAIGAAELSRRYPWLEGVPIDFGWHGITARTRDTEPIACELDDGLFFAGGYNGNGIMPGHFLGYSLAMRVAGTTQANDDPWFPIRDRPALPPEPLRHAVMEGAIRLQRRRDARRE